MPARTEATQGPDDAAASRRGWWSGVDQAHAMGVELMAAIMTWAAIGWYADRALGTGPWLLAIGAIIGNAAGIYLVWLRSARMERAEAALAERVAPGGAVRAN